MNRFDPLLHETRRHFFGQCALGVGSLALASLLSDGKVFAKEQSAFASPLAPRQPHFPARARNVIYLFMAGGPSQLELFDYKPKLRELDGQTAPESLLRGKRFAFMDLFEGGPPKLLGARRHFARHGLSGSYVSEALPHIASIVDDIAIVHGVATEAVNHAPAILFANTGTTQFGRPSMGAWVTYGLGSESANLPAFVVLQSEACYICGGAPRWGAGF